MFGYQEAEKLVERELKIQHALASKGRSQVLNVPLLLGPVGGGKSSIGWSRAQEWDLMFCPINCGENSDATDVAGVPDIASTMLGRVIDLLKDPSARKSDKDEARTLHMQWVLNKYAMLACTQPVFLFFDDLDKAPPPVQSAMLGITGTRMFKDRLIHPGTLIMGAGNRIDDDEYANSISESLRTRMTIIEMEPDLLSFSRYATESGEIHPVVLGYLQYKSEHLHQWKEGVNRFPTPRGWWEVSRHFEAYPNPLEDVFGNGRKDNWKVIVSRKCGDNVGNDFWAWYKIIQNIDVEKLLTTGALDIPAGGADRRMAEYAAVFAAAQRLSQKVESRYKGITPFVQSLQPEMRVAFVVQLPASTRSAIASMFEDAADVMMSDIVKTSGGVSFRPKTDGDEEKAA